MIPFSFFPTRFPLTRPASGEGWLRRERREGGGTERRNEQMADEGEDVDKNHGRVAVTGDRDVFATEVGR